MDKQKKLEATVINILAEYVGVKPEKLNLETHLSADLGIDSMSMVSLVARLEPYFGKSGDQLSVNYMQLLLDVETIEELIDVIREASYEK